MLIGTAESSSNRAMSSLLTRCFGGGRDASFSAKVEAFNSTVLGEETRPEDIPTSATHVMNNAALMPALPQLKLVLHGNELKLRRNKREEYLSLCFPSLVYVAKSDVHRRTLAIVTEEWEAHNTTLSLKCHIFRLHGNSKRTVEDVYAVLERLLRSKQMELLELEGEEEGMQSHSKAGNQQGSKLPSLHQLEQTQPQPSS